MNEKRRTTMNTLPDWWGNIQPADRFLMISIVSYVGIMLFVGWLLSVSGIFEYLRLVR